MRTLRYCCHDDWYENCYVGDEDGYDNDGDCLR